MDAQTLRRALADFFKFDPKYFFVKATATGFLVSPAPRALPVIESFPFRLIDATKKIDGVLTPRIRVVYGTVNGIDPDGMSVGDDPLYIVTLDTTSGRLWLELDFTVTDGIIAYTTASIDQGATVPTNILPSGDGDGSVFRQIGNWTTDGGTGKLMIVQDIYYSLQFELCGGATPLWGPG